MSEAVSKSCREKMQILRERRRKTHKFIGVWIPIAKFAAVKELLLKWVKSKGGFVGSS